MQLILITGLQGLPLEILALEGVKWLKNARAIQAPNSYDVNFWTDLETQKEEYLIVSSQITLPGETTLKRVPTEILSPKAIILVEGSIEMIRRVFQSAIHIESALIKEREAVHEWVEEKKIPLLTVTVHSEIFNLAEFITSWTIEILPFLNSLDAEEKSRPREIKNQNEIQCSVSESDPETTKELTQALEKKFPNRCYVQWDTWIGILITPPLDGINWNDEEFEQIRTFLTTYPGILNVDVPEKNRDGMARSTG